MSKSISEKGAFTVKDYVEIGKESDAFKKILDKVKSVGGDSTKLRDAIVNARLSIDNMSSRLYLQNLDGETAKGIADNFGRYTTTVYQGFEQRVY